MDKDCKITFEEENVKSKTLKMMKAQKRMVQLLIKCKKQNDSSILDAHDKSDWPEGPWKDEADYDKWVDDETGYECVVLRSPLGNLNGYVSIPRTHPIASKSQEEIEDLLEIHGGITWIAKDDFLPFFTEPNHYKVGFDCGHWTDIIPLMPIPHLLDTMDYISYRDINYVRNECKYLAKQLKDLELKKDD